MTIDEVCAAYGFDREFIATTVILLQADPAHEVHLYGYDHDTGLANTGLAVGVTPSQRAGVINEATGEVLWEMEAPLPRPYGTP